MSMITRTPVDAAEAIRNRRFEGKIAVGGFDIECIRWGKIVHIEVVRRLPKIHKDGRVTIRAFNRDYEIKAEECTLNSTGQKWISYDLA